MSLGAHKEVDQSDVIIFTIFASKGAQGYTDLDLSVSQKLHLVWSSKCYLEGRSEELQEPCPEWLVDLVTLYFYQFFLFLVNIKLRFKDGRILYVTSCCFL